MRVNESGRADYGVSVVRTVSALIVGLILGTAAAKGLGITEATLTPVVVVVVGGAYHALIRAIEHKWPKAGLLLGYAKAPTYPDKKEDGA